MERIKRLDRGSLKVEKTGQGYLRASATLTRSGVFVYRNADGSERREYRPPDEVFNADSLESLKLAPFTDGHPPDFLDPGNTKEYAVGTVGENISRDGQWVTATIQVTDSKTIEAIKSGKRDTSLGYWSTYDPTPGVTPEGERYDGIQRNIEYNHASLVDKGRAGSTIRLDAAEQLNPDKGAMVKKIKLDGLTFEVEPQLAEALEKEQEAATKLLDDAVAETDRERARADHAESELADAKKRLDSASAPEEVQKLVATRLELERNAALILDSSEDLAGKSDREILEAAVRSVCPEAKLDNASDEYVQARFDHILETRADALDEAKKIGDAALRSDAKSSIEKAREAFKRRNADRAAKSLENN